VTGIPHHHLVVEMAADIVAAAVALAIELHS
jgi:hypothetical protein